MNTEKKIEFLIEHIEKEIEAEERSEIFESITPKSDDDILQPTSEDESVLILRNENSEIKKSHKETLENNLALVAEDKEWFEVFDNKKELLDVLQ